MNGTRVPSVCCLGLGLSLALVSTAVAAAPEHFTPFTDQRAGSVIFLRNEAAEPSVAKLALRAKTVQRPTLPVFNRAELTTPVWSNEVAVAQRFLAAHGARFGEREPLRNLAPLRAERDGLGMTHVRYHQQYQGLPVFGTELVVHLTAEGEVSAAGGRLVPDIHVDTQPALSKEAATAIATALWQSQFQVAEMPEVRSATLCILAPGLLKNNGDPATHLVWEVKVAYECTNCDKALSLEDYYVDAHSGAVREQLTGVRHNIDRRIYDCSYYGGTYGCVVNRFSSDFQYWFGLTEGYYPCGPNPWYRPEISTDTADVPLVFFRK